MFTLVQGAVCIKTWKEKPVDKLNELLNQTHRAHDLLNGAHDLLNHVHDLLICAHNLQNC